MTTALSYTQAYQYATQAGFNPSSAPVIVAIAKAESGLNPGSQNCNNPGGSCDRGIVQINNYWHKEVSDACAYDPACAFKQAYRISNGGTSFSPWATYTNGAYKQYLNGASTEQQAQAPTGAGNALQMIGEKIGLFALAIVLIVVGFFLIAEKQVEGGLKGVAKVAKVAAIA